MNADDRTPPSGPGLYTPRPSDSADGARPARRAFMPVTTEQATSEQATSGQATSGQTPVRAPAPATGQTPATGQRPTTGTVPQRTAFRPQSAPSGIPTAQPTHAPAATPAAYPATSPQPAPFGNGAPADGSRFDGAIGAGTAALGAGTARIKGLAGRAAESFKAGDDLGTPTAKGGPRKARVLLSRIDPWSALKIGFLLSIAMGIMLVVAVFVMWNVLNGMGTFALVNEWVQKLFTNDQELNIMQFFDRNKVMSAAILVSVVNVVLLTALSTITAFLYNVVSSVVGGIYVTLTDD